MKEKTYAFKKRFEKIAFTFMASMLLMSCDAYDDKEVKKVTSECSDDVIDIEEKYVIDDDAEEDIHKSDLEKLRSFYKYIKENNIEFSSACEDYVFIHKKGLNDKFMYYDMTFKEEVDDKYYRGANCIYVSSNYLTDEAIKLSEGSFKGTDKTAVPVVLGYNYKDIAGVGEKIPFLYTNKNGSFTVKYLEVTGFAEPKLYVVTDVHIDNQVQIDNSIVISEEYYETIVGFDSDEEKKSNISYFYTDGFFKFNNRDQRYKAEEYSRELGLNFKFEKSFE